jgi:hypothetical protein
MLFRAFCWRGWRKAQNTIVRMAGVLASIRTEFPRDYTSEALPVEPAGSVNCYRLELSFRWSVNDCLVTWTFITPSHNSTDHLARVMVRYADAVSLTVLRIHASVAFLRRDLYLCPVMYSSEGNACRFTSLTDHTLWKLYSNTSIVCGNNKFVLQQVLKRYCV